LFNDGTLSGGEPEWQSHDFKRQKQVRENDCRVNLQGFGSSDGHFSREAWFPANFNEGMTFSYRSILRHVSPCLTHQPDWSAFNRQAFAGANQQ
jgi:hypothetical protein